jgi:two-component system sensor kinase FixL
VNERRLTVTTTANDGFVRIAVSDRGVGIPEDQRAAIFEPFVTFREQGLGLGLAISRSIILTHGGQILAENNSDRGATFTCLIPAAKTGDVSR